MMVVMHVKPLCENELYDTEIAVCTMSLYQNNKDLFSIFDKDPIAKPHSDDAISSEKRRSTKPETFNPEQYDERPMKMVQMLQ